METTSVAECRKGSSLDLDSFLSEFMQLLPDITMLVDDDGKNTGFDNVVHYARAACGIAGGCTSRIYLGSYTVIVVTLASYTVIIVTLGCYTAIFVTLSCWAVIVAICNSPRTVIVGTHLLLCISFLVHADLKYF